MRERIIFVFTFLVSVSFSQSTYRFPNKFNQIYNFHPEASLKQIDEEKDVEKKKAIQKYVVDYVFDEQFLFDSNKMYLDWGEAEVYLIKLLDTIFNNHAKEKKLDIFINRSPFSNAYSSRYGNIIINIGMLSEAEDEAFLANVISHEAAHFLFQHQINTLRMREADYNNTMYPQIIRKVQSQELQADSFAIAMVKKLDMSLGSSIRNHESMDVQEDFDLNGRSYKRMIKASAISNNEIRQKKFTKYNIHSSHPPSITRYDYARSEMEKCSTCSKRFIVDSAFFFKLKKFASEERKRKSFEACDFNGCITWSFKEYLYGSKSFRNLYYLIESLRRLIYTKPSLATFGFLTEYIDDPDLSINQSILDKPDYLYSSIQDYYRLKDHPFIADIKKPFRTYRDAFFYFSREAISKGLNEANLSMALYYYSIKNNDSTEKYLRKYIDNGNGISIDFAKGLLEFKKPIIKDGKMLFIYNNIGHYTNGSYNYYLCKKKKSENPVIRRELGKDTIKSELIIFNELLGNSPQRLYVLQNLIASVINLYDEEDIEMGKKVRLNSHFASEDKELSDNFKKHLLIFAPEWHTWLKENGYDKFFYVDMVYQYKEYMDGVEFYNDYTGYYLDMNSTRPYFKDSFRGGFKRKQTDEEMYKEINDFLSN